MSAPLDEAIRLLRAAILREEAVLDVLRRATPHGACCPTCYHGRTYADRVAAQERRLSWYATLLRKRGQPMDLAAADAAESGAWP